MKYKRIILKLSGEFLQSSKNQTIDFAKLKELAEEIFCIHKLGIEIGIVIGAGNLFRGRYRKNADWFPEISAHYMGILAGLPNAIALAQALDAKDAKDTKRSDLFRGGLTSLSTSLKTELMSAIPIGNLIPKVNAKKAQKALAQGKIVVFACGTGKPFVTNDTGAVMRALDIKADIILKATKVDGVYNKDPEKFSDAKKFDKLTFSQAIDLGLQVMDKQAFSLAQKNNLKILVFKYKKGSFLKAIKGKNIGTLVQKQYRRILF